MNVVLIYPFRRFTGLGAGSPIGILYLATYLKNHNFEVSVIDLGCEERSDDEIVNEILEQQPSIVGLPVYTPLMKPTYDLVTLLREKGYSGKIVIGAQQATALPEKTLTDFHHVDYLLSHEAETTLKKLADYIVNGHGQLSEIENLYYRDGTIKHTSLNPNINSNLDDLPFPDRSLLDKYNKRGLYNRPYTKGDCDNMITSRGCPFDCSFCFPSSSRYRARSAKNVVDEMRYLKDLGRSHVEIMDDTFTVNKKLVTEILQAVIENQLGLSLKIRSRVDLIDTEMLKLMKASGVSKIVFGIESGSDRMLKAMNKKTTAASNATAIALTKKAGIDCFADIFIGYPGETPESIKQTEEFLLKTKPTGVQLAIFYPLPLTRGYDEAKKAGTMVGDWSYRHNQVPYVKLEWIEDFQDLRRCARHIRRRYYLNPGVSIQTLRFLIKNTRLSDLPRIYRIARNELFPNLRKRRHA